MLFQQTTYSGTLVVYLHVCSGACMKWLHTAHHYNAGLPLVLIRACFMEISCLNCIVQWESTVFNDATNGQVQQTTHDAWDTRAVYLNMAVLQWYMHAMAAYCTSLQLKRHAGLPFVLIHVHACICIHRQQKCSLYGMFLKCHAPVCLVVGVSPLCSMMQQMVRKLHVQQCSIDSTSNVNLHGMVWGRLGGDWAGAQVQYCVCRTH